MCDSVSNESGGSKVPHLLDIYGLKTYFFTDAGVVRAVDGVDLSVHSKEILGIVGESGCGKTMMARSILRLVPKPGRIVAGRIVLEDGVNLLDLPETQMRDIRGEKISMVFQEPMVSLNPVYRIGNQIEEILIAHYISYSKNERRKRAIELLDLVGIPSPEQRVRSYPYELSGGMRQRAMIAMALACGSPKLLIADEPTTALDVTIQAQILELFMKLQQKIGMSVILITHDLGIVAEVANRVAVMYAGSIVETAAVGELFHEPLHPYTRGLLRSLPRRGKDRQKETLYSIPGTVPDLLKLKSGCKFFDRCAYAVAEICLGSEPVLEKVKNGHEVRCRRVGDITREESAG